MISPNIGTRSQGMTLDALVQEDVSRVEAWLEGVRSGEVEPPETFNWHGLAEGAAFRWRCSEETGSPDPRWGRIAVSIYDRLAAGTGVDATIGSSLSRSSMLLRASMIRAFGPLAGDPILDPAVVAGWFFDGLPMPFEVASEKARAPERCGIEDMRALVQIKDKLNVINLINKQNTHLFDRNMDKWLSLIPDLP